MSTSTAQDTEIPWLPQTWIDGIVKGDYIQRSRADLGNSKALRWLEERPAAHEDPCCQIQDSLDRGYEELQYGSAHDSIVNRTKHILHLAREGHRGSMTALEALREHFVYEVSGNRRSKALSGKATGTIRTQRAAAEEWARNLTGGINLDAAEGAYTSDTPCNCDEKYEDMRDPSEFQVEMRAQTEFGNADRMYDWAGHKVRKSTDGKMWYVYDGRRWVKLPSADSSILLGFARKTIELATEHEAELYSPEGDPGKSPREKFLAFMRRQETSASVSGMVRMLGADERVFCDASTFNQNHYLFNCSNGVLDLRTGELKEHDPADMLTHLSRVEWEGLSARAPKFHKFLRRVQKSQDMRDYLQRIAGYTLTGSTDEQAFFIHHGKGQNGKGLWAEVMRAVMGEYHQTVAKSAFLENKGGSGHPTDLARIEGKRFLEMQETNAGQMLDNERLKSIASGDVMTARYLNQEFFEFKPAGKLHIITNFLPSLGAGGFSMERRIHNISWDETITEEEKNPALAEEIIAEELPGVLAWAVQGAIAWIKQGLSMPESARGRVKEHVESSRPLQMWADELVNATKIVRWIHTEDVYKSFVAHWHETGHSSKPISINTFPMALEEHFESVRRKDEDGKPKKCRGEWCGNSQCRKAAVSGVKVQGLISPKKVTMVPKKVGA